MEDMHAEVEKKMERCDKRLETLWTHMEDLENQTRRNNISVVELLEGKEEMVQWLNMLRGFYLKCLV